MNEGHRFTPRRSDGSRPDLRISDADHAKMLRGQEWQATVTDIQTGTTYYVAGAECGLPGCFCDAVVLDVH
jgi:hypothetical protein